MNRRMESKSLDTVEEKLEKIETEELKTKKFDFDQFDPQPLKPEGLEDISSELENVTKKRLQIEIPKSESFKIEMEKEKTPQEQMSALGSALTAFSLVGQVGLVMFASVAIGLVGGIYIDRWLGTGYLFLIVLTLLGVASGFKAVYSMVKKLIK
jgi:F0F1-type ATP synthase assembly protein I